MSNLSQSQLNQLSCDIMANFDYVCEILNLKLLMSSKYYYGACPVHGGDNESALNIFYTGDKYIGNWQCHTHGCHTVFVNSALGFLRGVLSHQKCGWANPGDQTVSFSETLKFAYKLLNKDIEYQNNPNLDQNMFINQNTAVDVQEVSGVPRNVVRSALSIPASYYIDRHYSPDILDQFDVGLCTKTNKEMSNRIVVPIYDDSNSVMIGCTGRSMFEKCPKCNLYHNPLQVCPDKKYSGFYLKWRHSKGFRRENSLYNLWNAKPYIKSCKVAVVVEGPGDVWRLEEAKIKNSVALFGDSLTAGQQALLNSLGVLSLLVLTDNDRAGNIALENIKKQCELHFNISSVKLPNKDVGDMTVEQIKQIIQPKLDELMKEYSQYG